MNPTRHDRFGWAHAFFVLAGAWICTAASAETINCDGAGGAGSGAGRISAVPYVISAAGVYCLTQKITSNLSSGAAITINANNVELDLNSFTIGNLPAGASTSAVGVYAVDRQNIVIKNGILRGFWAAIALVNGTTASSSNTTALSSGHTVEGITCDSSYFLGMVIEGPFAAVRGNTVINTKGSTVLGSLLQGAQPTAPNAANAITVRMSSGAVVEGNLVVDTDCTNACTPATAAAFGIDVAGSVGASISGNVVANAAIPTAGESCAIAIDTIQGTTNVASTGVFVGGNTLTNWNQGIRFSAGSVGPPAVPASSGAFRANQALGVTNPYNNGGNNVPSSGANFSF
jgi:hypothetical protein